MLALTRQNLPQLRNFLDKNPRARLRNRRQWQGKYRPPGLGSSIAADGASFAAGGVAARSSRCPASSCWRSRRRPPRIGDAPIKIGVEAAVRQGWDAVIGSDGLFVGMNTFGASAPYKELYKKFGITAEAVAAAAMTKLR